MDPEIDGEELSQRGAYSYFYVFFFFFNFSLFDASNDSIIYCVAAIESLSLLFCDISRPLNKF